MQLFNRFVYYLPELIHLFVFPSLASGVFVLRLPDGFGSMQTIVVLTENSVLLGCQPYCKYHNTVSIASIRPVSSRAKCTVIVRAMNFICVLLQPTHGKGAVKVSIIILYITFTQIMALTRDFIRNRL